MRNYRGIESMDSAYAIVWFRGFTEDPHFDGVMWERNWDTTALRGIGDQDSMAWRPEVEQSVTVNAWILANKRLKTDHTRQKRRLWRLSPVFTATGVAVNRGADFVKHLVPSLRARTRYLTGHREPHSQTAFACTAHGAGQHRD